MLAEFDLNLDGKLDDQDTTTFVHDIAQTSFGDANLDGVFDSTDLVLVFQAGLYNTQEDATWISGTGTATENSIRRISPWHFKTEVSLRNGVHFRA